MMGLVVLVEFITSVYKVLGISCAIIGGLSERKQHWSNRLDVMAIRNKLGDLWVNVLSILDDLTPISGLGGN